MADSSDVIIPVISTLTCTVRPQDPGGNSASSEVVITVLDADSKAPQFKHSAYTIEALDREVGRLQLPGKLRCF